MDQELDKETPEVKLTLNRRRFVRAAVAGSAALGAAAFVKPSMEELGVSSAEAQRYAQDGLACPEGCGVCFDQQPCARGIDEGCSCVVMVEKPCFCHQGSFCTDLKACKTTADCPAGCLREAA